MDHSRKHFWAEALAHLNQITPLQSIQQVFMQFSRRAEHVSNEILSKTFVDAEPLFIQLSSRNHQVFYGRRGTGKTHALKFLAESIQAKGDKAVYIDLRVVGSNGSIYTDGRRSIAERSSRLLIDVLEAIEQELIRLAVEMIDASINPEQITYRLDDLSKAVRSVAVRGSFESEQSSSAEAVGKISSSGTISPSKVGFDLATSFEGKHGQASKIKQSGEVIISIDFGPLQTALAGLLDVLGAPTIWLLVDEWSEIPLELQPLLADLIKRTILPQTKIIVKIAAIEHRSNFALAIPTGGYLGIELGADVTADINLDEFVVFDVDHKRATEFYKSLLFKHYSVSENADPSIDTPDKLIGEAFTQVNAFQEYVRAVEGVPRDALNVAAAMARIAWGRAIAINDVRRAAREWYQQDKMSATKSAPRLAEVLNHIVLEVIEHRRARAFLFPAGVSSEDLDKLYDARLIHLLKKSISSHDEPGKRYDVYKIDYGCYVDLISTSKAPTGLLIDDEGRNIDVPPDDYRSIRGAILRSETLPPNMQTLN